MNYFQMSSLDPIAANFSDQFNLNISQGSLFNFCVELYKKLDPWENWMVKILITQNLLHADETGANVIADKLWLHTMCNPNGCNLGY